MTATMPTSDQVKERIASCERELRHLRRLLRAASALERAEAERRQREGSDDAHR